MKLPCDLENTFPLVHWSNQRTPNNGKTLDDASQAIEQWIKRSIFILFSSSHDLFMKCLLVKIGLLHTGGSLKFPDTGQEIIDNNLSSANQNKSIETNNHTLTMLKLQGKPIPNWKNRIFCKNLSHPKCLSTW